MIRLAAAAAVGAVLGSLARYGIGLALPPAAGLPLATLVVNIVGAFLIGAVAQLPGVMDNDVRRHFVVTGLLGGFTTFSALALDTVRLLGRPWEAVVYLTLTFGGGLAATHVGWRVVRR